MIKSILITGASRGIGAAIVKKIANSVDSVDTIVTVARASEDYDRLIDDLSKKHPDKSIEPFSLDVSDDAQIKLFIDQIKQRGIVVDGIINNAGYTNPKSINESSVDDFLHTLKVNLLAPFSIVQRVIKLGKYPKLIINIASTAGINGRPGWLTYSASKAALINMTEVMREELKVYGTRVVCLSPGRCATDLRRILAPDEDPATIMQPEQVADIVGLMCSETGMLIDSQNLVVRV